MQQDKYIVTEQNKDKGVDIIEPEFVLDNDANVHELGDVQELDTSDSDHSDIEETDDKCLHSEDIQDEWGHRRKQNTKKETPKPTPSLTLRRNTLKHL
ncbi:hypothetical protein L1887_26776 [Cichorium endivia]|nr:hypothetical protein L1887_26776 [Cichorium endivia]